MKSSKKKTTVAPIRSRAQTSREKEATRRLKAPRWSVWLAKPDVSPRQAALLTMGLAPEPGIVTLLKTKPRKYVEFRRREQSLEKAYGESKWLPRGATLPRTATVRGALEFASEAEWVLAKTAISALGRLRHLHPVARPDEAGKSVASTAAASPPAHAPVAAPIVSTIHIESEAMSRKDERLQQVLGAALVLLERGAKNGLSKEYLRGDKLNVSVLAGDIIGTIGGGAELKHSLAGLSVRNISKYISDAIEPYRRRDAQPDV